MSTGRICFEGNVQNQANQNTFGTSFLSVDADNDATVNNQAGIQATTGNNQMNDNTKGDQADEADDCPEKLAQAPTPSPAPQASPSPTPGGVGGSPAPEAPTGQGGVEGAAEEGRVVAAVTPEERHGRINGGIKLQRFPVAGSYASAQWLAGQRSLPWMAFAVAGIAVVGFAHQLDRRARIARLTAAVS